VDDAAAGTGIEQAMQMAYPLVSPLVGMLGAFATGSKNNSTCF